MILLRLVNLLLQLGGAILECGGVFRGLSGTFRCAGVRRIGRVLFRGLQLLRRLLKLRGRRTLCLTRIRQFF